MKDWRVWALIVPGLRHRLRHLCAGLLDAADGQGHGLYHHADQPDRDDPLYRLAGHPVGHRGFVATAPASGRCISCLSALVCAVGFCIAALGAGNDCDRDRRASAWRRAGPIPGLATFWSVPPLFLGGTAAAGAFALINSVGNLSGFVGPGLMGCLLQSTGSYHHRACGCAPAWRWRRRCPWRVLAGILPHAMTNSDLVRSDKILARAAWRLIPFMSLMYVVSFLDRVEYLLRRPADEPRSGLFAASLWLRRRHLLLGLFPVRGAVQPGAAEGGRAALDVPHLRHLGLALHADGLCASEPVSFCILRFLLGAAEAGLYPGMILYMTYWFPQSTRARFIALVPGRGAAVGGDRRPDLRLAAGCRGPWPAWLAMDDDPGRHSVAALRRRHPVGAARRPGQGQMAERGGKTDHRRAAGRRAAGRSCMASRRCCWTSASGF